MSTRSTYLYLLASTISTYTYSINLTLMLTSHIGNKFSSSSYRNSPLQNFPSAASSLLLLVNSLLIVDWLPQFPVSQRTQPVDFPQGLSFIPSWRHVACRVSSGWRAFWYNLIIGLFVIKLNDVLTTPQLLIGFRAHDDVLVVTPSDTPTQPLADLSIGTSIASASA